MLVDASSPHGSNANLAVVGTLFEGFGRIVTSPPYLVGYVRWDARSNLVTSCQTIVFNSFTGRSVDKITRQARLGTSARYRQKFQRFPPGGNFFPRSRQSQHQLPRMVHQPPPGIEDQKTQPLGSRSQ
jgi:hypothetical protein